MRKSLMALPFVAVVFLACDKTREPITFDSISVKDSLTENGTVAKYAQQFDYPTSGTNKQQTWLRQWLALEMAGGNDSLAATPEHTAQLFDAAKLNIKPNAPKSVAEAGKNVFFTDFKESLEEAGELPGFEADAQMRAVLNTGKLLTYCYTGHCYFGVENGYDFAIYTNFDMLKNKQLMTDDIIVPEKQAEVRKLVLKQLQTYFNAGSQEELIGHLMEFNDTVNLETFPLPVATPGLTKDSVVFQYLRYEISGNEDGLPRAAFAYKEVWDCLTPAVQRLLGEK